MKIFPKINILSYYTDLPYQINKLKIARDYKVYADVLSSNHLTKLERIKVSDGYKRFLSLSYEYIRLIEYNY
jgi:hypothetical protein